MILGLMGQILEATGTSTFFSRRFSLREINPLECSLALSRDKYFRGKISLREIVPYVVGISVIL